MKPSRPTAQADPPQPPDRPASDGDRLWRWLAVASGLLFVGLTLHAARVETPTIDELAHVPAGCAYWKFGRLDLYAENPPLFKQLMAIPVLLSGAEVPEPQVAAKGWGPWLYGYQFLGANHPRYLVLFLAARCVPIVTGLLTGVLLYAWASELFGRRGGALSATLFWLNPNVLAHSHLATIDMACAFSIVLTLYVFRWAYRQPSLRRVAVLGGVWGLALSIKFTAVLLLPALLLLIALERRKNWQRGVAEAMVLTVCAAATINVAMGFKGSFAALGEYRFASSFLGAMQNLLPAALPVPLPRDYVTGFDLQKLDTERGEFNTYLLGGWSSQGRWYYDLVALSVKTPLSVLALSLLAGWRLGHTRSLRRELAIVLIPAATLFLALALFNQLKIGIRYLLPLVPLGYLLLAVVWQHPGRWQNCLGAAILALHLAACWLVYPNYLTYFNLAAGGPAHGHRVLLDSNLDWGQDLYRLPAALRELGYRGPIGLLYFGHVHPALYEIEFQMLPPTPVEGVLAVSVHYLLGGSYVATGPDGRLIEISGDHAVWLRAHRPVLKAGSIWIYDTRGRVDGS